MNCSSVSGKNWIFSKFDSSDVTKFSETYSISHTVAKLLSIRKDKIENINAKILEQIVNCVVDVVMVFIIM